MTGSRVCEHVVAIRGRYLYRTSDRVLENREEVEKGPADRERKLLQLGEKVILHDLTRNCLKCSGQ